MSELLKNVAVPPGNRRSFVRNLALASAAAGIVASPNKANAQTTDTTDVDILNFALNLEYLEAEFYTMATAGTTIDNFGITITGSGTAGATTGGGMIPFSTTDNTVQRVAEELARDEAIPCLPPAKHDHSVGRHTGCETRHQSQRVRPWVWKSE